MRLPIFILSFSLVLFETVAQKKFTWVEKKKVISEPEFSKKLVPIDGEKKPLVPLPKKKPAINENESKKTATKAGTDFGKEIIQKGKKLNPKDVWAKLNNVKSHDDFFNLFPMSKSINIKKVKIPMRRKEVIGAQDEVAYVFSDLSGKSLAADTSSSSVQLVSYNCEPRPKVVELPISSEGAYWPACTEIKQCGGCCSHLHFKECVPTALENITATVTMVTYALAQIEVRNVILLQHKECDCKCRIKPSDCKPKQTHDEQSCSCRCLTNPSLCSPGKEWSDDDCDCMCKQKPQNCPNRQTWNTDTCQCACENTPCSEYYIRDPNTCLCIYFGKQ